MQSRQNESGRTYVSRADYLHREQSARREDLAGAADDARDGAEDAVDGDTVKEDGSGSSRRKRSILREILSNSLFLLAVLIVTLLLVRYVGQRTVVVGESMEPTLNNGDNLIVDKLSYRLHDPERFDIIVFPFAYKEGTYYIKRIIGLPGERVRIDEAGNIYINGTLLVEHYGAEVIADPGIAVNEILLGEGQYFVLGDNRNHSSDSRTASVGLISRDKIIGRALVRLYPFNKIRLLKP